MEFDYNNMTQDQEHSYLISLIKSSGESILDTPECYSEIKEELNNEVLSKFEADYSELAFENSEDEPDYSGLTDDIFDKLLREICDELSVSTLISYGDCYSVLREKYNNQILDQYEADWKSSHSDEEE